MVTPRIVPRAEHPLSRKDIDPDALKVLNRLRHFDHTAYLVGGSVRDLLLGRRPKDFDIGTSAHPYEVKRIFRNCWIVGRRFRLAHVKFGTKTIEVATFRRQVSDIELEAMAEDARLAAAEADRAEAAEAMAAAEREAAEREAAASAATADEDARVSAGDGGVVAPLARRSHTHRRRTDQDHLVHRDNTFGTPEEDAFRRDFTVNALFYDIATFSIIDYVGGLEDVQARVIRCIGDPDVRFREDPVRMLRAIVLAARLDFTVDPPVIDAIRRNAAEIGRSAQARLLDEFYKILRSGASERAFRELADVGLLQHIAPELLAAGGALWQSLAELDAYRHRFAAPPDALTNPVLIGTLLVPRGFSLRRPWRDEDVAEEPTDGGERRRRRRPKPDFSQSNATLGLLPLARGDLERLRQLLGLQRRVTDMQSSPRAKRSLIHRGPFQDALAWLDIHGQAPEVVEHWRGFIEAAGSLDHPLAAPLSADAPPMRRRRRRGRRRRVDDRLL